jgi:hypothetical protein
LESVGSNISVSKVTVSFSNSTVTANSLTFDAGSILNVGHDLVTFAADASSNDRSVINVSAVDSVVGAIAVTGQTLTFNDDVQVRFAVYNVSIDDQPVKTLKNLNS